MSGLIKKYSSYLPVAPQHIVTLHEGDTPLMLCHRLAEHLKIPHVKLYLKFEGLNPTGSFKDRGMTYAMSKAIESGSRAVICASTGNTSASAAAYAARAGINCVVLIPKGKIAYGKLAQAIQYGAKILQVRGNFDDALTLVRDIGATYPITIVNSVNPYRLQGQMTAAFEVVDELGHAPDYHFLPVGNAGNISAYWMGYKKYFSEKKCTQLPKMMGWQASGAAPLVSGKIVNDPQTIATAIRIGNPASKDLAIAARDESHGMIGAVTDKEILTAYRLVAKLEGYFCEPASAASIAGLMKHLKKNSLPDGTTVVCTLTGNGLKDPDTAIDGVAKPQSFAADVKQIVKALRL